MQALLLPLHRDWYAIELTRVLGVVTAPAVTPLPGAPPALLGLFNLRGDVVPLFDTALLLGLAGAPAADRIAIAETSRGKAGLTAHGRPRRETLREPAGPADRPAGVGRFAVDGAGVATLLDVDRLLAEAGSPAA